MFPLCLNGWIRCWQQVSMHRSNITLFISPKTRAGWSFLYVLIQMWLTRPDQTRAHPTNHIHMGSADYSCRYKDIIGWKEKGIKTFICNNICAFQFCLSPMSHRTFGYLCRSAGQFIQFVRLTHRLISTPADTWSRLWGRISGACIWTAVEYFAPDVWTVRFLLKHKQKSCSSSCQCWTSRLRRRWVSGMFGFYQTSTPPTFPWCQTAPCCWWTTCGTFRNVCSCEVESLRFCVSL